MSIFVATSSGGKKPGRAGRGASIKPADISDEKKILIRKQLLKAVCIVLVVTAGFITLKNLSGIYKTVSTQKIEHVLVEGNLEYLSRGELENAVFQFLGQGLVELDLDNIKVELEENPWVKSVNIRREWPDKLVINVTEEMAIARWQDGKLLSRDGEVFSPLDVAQLSHLPALFGPEGTEYEVMTQYQQLNQLLSPQGLRIIRLELNRRNSWVLGLENGVEVKVGSSNVIEKIRRLIGAVDSIFVKEIESIESIDLRYSNGIAVSRKLVKSEEIVSR